MNRSEEEEAGKGPSKMSFSEGEPGETTEPIRGKETTVTESLKMGSLEQQPGGAGEHVGIEGALGSEDLSPPVEMPLPGEGSIQQSAARSQLREEQPGGPEEVDRSKRPHSPVLSDWSKDSPLKSKRRRQEKATDGRHYCEPDLEEHQLQDLQPHGHDVTEQDPQGTHHKSSSNREYVPPPGQIQFSSVTPDSVTVSWSPPEDAAGPHRYRVSWRRGSEQHSATVGQLMMEVTGLLPGQKYHFTVATLSEDGRQSTCVEGSVQTVESSDNDGSHDGSRDGSPDGDRPNTEEKKKKKKKRRRRKGGEGEKNGRGRGDGKIHFCQT